MSFLRCIILLFGKQYYIYLTRVIHVVLKIYFFYLIYKITLIQPVQYGSYIYIFLLFNI